MKYRIVLYFLIVLMFAVKPMPVAAQNVAISTNALDWLNFGTLNLSIGVDVSRHFSLEAGTRYNPWSFDRKSSGLTIKNQQTTAFAGVRFWPWYIFSGWWIAARCQYSKFSDTGIWRYALNEGTALGAGLSFGYTLMISKHFNLEFGAGLWGGKLLEHTLYHCPECMRIREEGPGFFISPDNISVSVIYIF